MAMGSVIWSVLLLGGCLIMGVSGQTTIMSSLQATNRMYVCPGEIVTYVCIGAGEQIRLSAPPHISFPLSYVRGDALGSGRLGDGPIVSNLISTTPPLMEADLIVQNSSLGKFFVRCTVPPSAEAVTQHKPSGPPLDVNSSMIRSFFTPNEFNIAGVGVNWTANDGNYDPSHFTIQLVSTNTNTEVIKPISISAESNIFQAIFAVPFNAPMSVYANITVTSKCSQTTSGVLTNTIPINKSIKTVYVFWVLLSAATIVLTII